MPEKLKGQHFEMTGIVGIDDAGETVQISIDTGASLERFSLQRERFSRIKKIAQSRGLPVDVFIDRSVSEFGFGKDLFDKILAQEASVLKDKK